jgi:DNA modification methylase
MTLPINQIICGDNCDALGTLPRACIDLVVTSPPYDDLRTYGGHSWDFYGVAWQLKRVLKPGGVIVWVVADATKDGSETGSSMEQALHFKLLGLNLHDTMIYRTAKPPANCSKRYQPCFEFAFVFSNGAPTTFNPLMVRCLWAGFGTSPTQRNQAGELVSQGRRRIQDAKPRENIWDYGTGSGKTDTTDHPAAFPDDLARDHILSWSNEGDIVLDPFNGSGTTTKMAREMGRKYIGIEVNPDYCKIAEARLKQQLLPLEAAS